MAVRAFSAPSESRTPAGYCPAPNRPVSCSAMDAITYAGAARTRVWPRRLAWAAGSLLALVLLFLAGTNLYVIYGPHGSYTSNVERVPHAQAAIVLGAQVEPSGRMSPMLADRVQQTIAL